MSITIQEIHDLLSRIPKLHFGIAGDFCLDAYLTIDASASETSVETGLPTLPVVEQRYSLGGAGNVAHNLTALGAKQVQIFGVIGNDPFGWKMQRLCARIGADTSGLLIQRESWDTPTYTKVIEHGREDRRLDFGNFNTLIPGIAEALLTTAAGLTIALITLFPYNAFRGQIGRTLSRIEALAAAAGTAQPGNQDQP